MLDPPLAGRTVKHLVDVPLDCQQIIDLPLLRLALGVPSVLFGKQGLDFRRQRLGAALQSGVGAVRPRGAHDRGTTGHSR